MVGDGVAGGRGSHAQERTIGRTEAAMGTPLPLPLPLPLLGPTAAMVRPVGASLGLSTGLSKYIFSSSAALRLTDSCSHFGLTCPGAPLMSACSCACVRACVCAG